MKSVKPLAWGAVLALSLVGASSAPAANWDPQNTNVTMTQEGASTLTFGSGSNISCTNAHTTLRAVGAVATTTSTVNPLSLTNCATPFGAMTVTTFGDWSFTATSTTSVDATWTSSTGTVATFHLPGLGCDITITSPVHIPNNTWNNVTHTLSNNGAVSIPIEGSGFCGSTFGSTLKWDANFVAPVATIT